MESLSKELVGEGEGTAEQRFVLRASEAAQLGLVGGARIRRLRIGKSKVESGAAEPPPTSVGCDCGWPLSEECKSNSGGWRYHGHAYLPGIQHDKGGDLAASHDGGHARGSLGWGSVHRIDDQGFGPHRRRCGMMRLVK